MSAVTDSFRPAEGQALATTFVAAGEVAPLARALKARAFLPLAALSFSRVDGILGWGRKPSARRAERTARRRKLPFWTVEDGFLRSVGLGKAGMPSLSYVIDDLGIYYDAAAPSRLERLIAETRLCADAQARADQLRQSIVRARLSKYCDIDDQPVALGPRDRRRILIVDQTAGDSSLSGGLAGADAFAKLFAVAAGMAGEAQFFLRPHPDVAAGLAASAAGAAARAPFLAVLEGNESLCAVFDEMDEVWTVSSQAGFDALLRGLKVRTFGVPFYAGWGLTDDCADNPNALEALARRSATPRTLADLVHAALIAYPVYVDPHRDVQISAEEAVSLLSLWRDQARKIGRDHLCVGFSRWKRPHARAYLGVAGGTPKFVSEEAARAQARAGDRVVVWGMKARDAFADEMRSRGAIFARMEDGFIRSFGLGSDFLFPWSLCLDETGIYYDARHPSDLETLINSGPAASELVERGRRLRLRLAEMGISKYNLPGKPPDDLRRLAGGKPVLLVAGQVPDDFSLQLGLALFPGNVDFLAAVRAENPDAFLVYKEHPDVVSGNRAGASAPAQLASLADLVVTQGNISQWIDACDHIHVMTSLAGFEALLRNRPVTCWGAPFYAGWGLTQDRLAIGRRRHRPPIDELAGRVLIEYNLFRVLTSLVPISVERLLDVISGVPPRIRSSELRNGVLGQSYRLFGYIGAQVAGSLGRGQRKKLRPSAGARWPFFRKIP